MATVRRLIAKNPTEARGIRKALRAMGLKFEFKTTKKKRRARRRRNSTKKRRTKGKTTRARRRR